MISISFLLLVLVAGSVLLSSDSSILTRVDAFAAAPSAPAIGRHATATMLAMAATDTKTPVETFRKADFVASVAEKTGMSKKESEGALKAVLDTLQEQVGAGKRVNLPGFGTFTLRERAARKGRNPRTGEDLEIAASKSPGFSAAKAWKDAINGKK